MWDFTSFRAAQLRQLERAHDVQGLLEQELLALRGANALVARLVTRRILADASLDEQERREATLAVCMFLAGLPARQVTMSALIAAEEHFNLDPAAARDEETRWLAHASMLLYLNLEADLELLESVDVVGAAARLAARDVIFIVTRALRHPTTH